MTGYTTGGTIHIIINNQIGFTTSPADARSTTYCTDVAKMMQVPIFHVNAEDPEAAVYVAELALDFRQDVRHAMWSSTWSAIAGTVTTKGDEPSFTQPLMYRKIRERPTLAEVYTEQLILSGDLTTAEMEALSSKFQEKLKEAQEEVKPGDGKVPGGMRGFAGHWTGLSPHYSHAPVATGVPLETPRNHHRSLDDGAREFHGASQDCPATGGAAQGIAAEETDRLGLRRGAVVRHADAGGTHDPAERPGQPPRHLQSAPCRAVRCSHRASHTIR